MKIVFFSDYKTIPEVFGKIKGVASEAIVEQVQAVYLFDVKGKQPDRKVDFYLVTS
jgi:hypothetical protein